MYAEVNLQLPKRLVPTFAQRTLQIFRLVPAWVCRNVRPETLVVRQT